MRGRHRSGRGRTPGLSAALLDERRAAVTTLDGMLQTLERALHDGALAELAVLKLRLSLLAHRVDTVSTAASERGLVQLAPLVDQATAQARSVVERIRRIAGDIG